MQSSFRRALFDFFFFARTGGRFAAIRGAKASAERAAAPAGQAGFGGAHARKRTVPHPRSGGVGSEGRMADPKSVSPHPDEILTSPGEAAYFDSDVPEAHITATHTLVMDAK